MRERSAYAQGGPVAQWLEQATHNRSVAGSIPARPTIRLVVSVGILATAFRGSSVGRAADC